MTTGKLRDVISQGGQVAKGRWIGAWGQTGVELVCRRFPRHQCSSHIRNSHFVRIRISVHTRLSSFAFSVSPLVITRFALEAWCAQFSQGFGGVPGAWFQGVHRFELHDAQGGVLNY